MREAEVIRERVKRIIIRAPLSLATVQLLELITELLLDIREERK